MKILLMTLLLGAITAFPSLRDRVRTRQASKPR